MNAPVVALPVRFGKSAGWALEPGRIICKNEKYFETSWNRSPETSIPSPVTIQTLFYIYTFNLHIFVTNLEVTERFFFRPFRKFQNVETDGLGERFRSSTVTTSPITTSLKQADRWTGTCLCRFSKRFYVWTLVQVVNSDDSCLLPLHFPKKACWKASFD
jgi:hypothetical protein